MTRKQLEGCIVFSHSFQSENISIDWINQRYGLNLTDQTTNIDALTAYIEANDIVLSGDQNFYKGLIEVNPMKFVPDHKSNNPYDGETVVGDPIMVAVYNIAYIEGSYIELKNGRQYNLAETYEEVKELIKSATNIKNT